MEYLTWLEQSSFATWVRESSSIWSYPTILCLHTVGLGLLVGISAAINLRILGFVPSLPLAPLEKFFPILWIGFWLNFISGTALLIADATLRFRDPIFYIKMTFVILAVVTLQLLRREVFCSTRSESISVSRLGKVLASLSLIFWTGAIAAGRLIAYLGT